MLGSVLLVTASYLNGCGADNSSKIGADVPVSAARPLASAGPVDQVPSDTAPNYDRAVNEKRLERLFQERATTATESDYALGPGDILEVSAQDVPELREFQARVNGDGTISLPIVGAVNIEGLTEETAKNRIRERLSRYVHDPEVDVFVREYRSRVVMVMGMVQKPGMYALNSPSETVLEVIGRAGGNSERSASDILLMPSQNGNQFTSAMGTSGEGEPTGLSTDQNSPTESVDGGALQKTEAVVPSAATTTDAPELGSMRQPADLQERRQWIVLDPSGQGNSTVLTLPARPGDVIMVPAAGEVMVQGWVHNPGAFVITPRMTALGAVAAAGGEMFSSSASLLRPGSDDGKDDYELDLDKIKKREAR